MDDAKVGIKATLSLVKTFLAQERPPRLSEADTKANFIEPVLAGLGWSGIGVVTREYYVENSGEFIDYVMSGSTGPLLAIEANALQVDLTDKFAAQLIQYCSVEGIEWAALTNGRELQFFNTFLKPDLATKRILSIDLLAFNNDAEFDALFNQLWQLSQTSMTTPSGVHTWLTQRRMDTLLRTLLLDPDSSTIRQLRRSLSDAEIRVSSQDVTQWFRSHLGTAASMVPIPAVTASLDTSGSDAGDFPIASGSVSLGAAKPSVTDIGDRSGSQGNELSKEFKKFVSQQLPDTQWRETKYYTAGEANGGTFVAFRTRSRWLFVGLTLPSDFEDERLSDNKGQFNWRRITKVIRVGNQAQIGDSLMSIIKRARDHAVAEAQHSTFYGVTLQDLVQAGMLVPGTRLVLTNGGRDVTHAELTSDGQIKWQGGMYRSLSDRAFARALSPSRTSLNGWTHWYAELPTGRIIMAEARRRLIESQTNPDATRTQND